MSGSLRQRINPLYSKSLQAVSNSKPDTLAGEDYLKYQLIQRSKVPTFHFQKSLPRLPIPKLELTCERYLAAQRPLLIDEAYRKTEYNVNRFANTTGQQLHQMLKDFDKNHKNTSYISGMWFDMYLRDRIPLPINYNPLLVLNNDEREEFNSQLIKTSNLIISSLRFYNSLKSSLIEPEVFHLNPQKSDTEFFRTVCSQLPESLSWYGAYLFKAYPLDMSQYPSLFNSTRIPEIDKDRLIKTTDSTHITVQYKGHFYAFNVFSANHDILPAEQILTRLNFILNDDIDNAEFPIGPLTTLNRDRWATLRHELLDAGNETKLKLIDSALFNVCLDSQAVEGDPYKIVKQFLHADSTNRWFDKSFSLIVTKDGYAGLNFEHSWGDGVAVLRYLQDIYKDSRQQPQVTPDTNFTKDNIDEVYRLDMNLTDRLKQAITDARKAFEQTCSSLNINYLLFDGIGKKLCKTELVSPDAVMQLGFQVAYHKLTGKFVATYESCSTAAFKHGRTETLRPCTTATKNMALALNNTSSRLSILELKQMLAECSRVHGQLTREAVMGQGFDRHLFALKHFATENGTTNNIFEAPEFAAINKNIISTSTLNSPVILAGGFGPVVQNGLGIGYAIKDDSLGVLVTNYDGHSDGEGFTDALKVSFAEILTILQAKN